MEAKFAFEEIKNKDVVSWNCLINGYSQEGQKGCSLVMKLFHRMRTENILPNPHTFAGVFTAASNLSDDLGGKQAHSLAIKTDCCSDIFVGSSLLNMYCKAGLVLDARLLFDRMPRRNSVTWATMISGCSMNGMTKEAAEHFRLMGQEGQEATEFIFTSVLSAFALAESIENGRQIHCLATKNGLFSFVSVGNSLVTMYSKCGSLYDALKTFELLSDKNAITWSAMITGYAQSGDSSKSLELFKHMHFSGLMPSEFTLVGVLNACSDSNALVEGKQVHAYSLKLGYETQIFILTALVDMYAKCSSIADARKGFDYLQEPDIVLWTSMISGCAQNGEYEEALSLYSRMKLKGILPNELTIASLLKACSALASLELGKQIHARAFKHGFSREIPIGSALSTMYAKCGSLDDGHLVFRRMPKRDVVAWNSMISGLSQNGCGDEALKLFNQMREEGTKPDYVTFVNILSACSHMGLVHEGWTYFKMMLDEFGLTPRVEHCACMVDILSRAGKLYEAKEFIESATIDNKMCLWRVLLGACKNYRNYELGAYAGERLIELGSKESSAYVLLSSIYSALNRREDVERVRKIMKIQGISKEPGCSWIEIKSQVHVFVVGDQLHPQVKEIREAVRSLSKEMMDEGYRPDVNLTNFQFRDHEASQSLVIPTDPSDLIVPLIAAC